MSVNGWDRGEIEAARLERSLADVAAWEAKRRPAPAPLWWGAAIGAVLALWVLALGYAARRVWEMVG